MNPIGSLLILDPHLALSEEIIALLRQRVPLSHQAFEILVLPAFIHEAISAITKKMIIKEKIKEGYFRESLMLGFMVFLASSFLCFSVCTAVAAAAAPGISASDAIAKSIWASFFVTPCAPSDFSVSLRPLNSASHSGGRLRTCAIIPKYVNIQDHIDR